MDKTIKPVIYEISNDTIRSMAPHNPRPAVPAAAAINVVMNPPIAPTAPLPPILL